MGVCSTPRTRRTPPRGGTGAGAPREPRGRTRGVARGRSPMLTIMSMSCRCVDDVRGVVDGTDAPRARRVPCRGAGRGGGGPGRGGPGGGGVRPGWGGWGGGGRGGCRTARPPTDRPTEAMPGTTTGTGTTTMTILIFSNSNLGLLVRRGDPRRTGTSWRRDPPAPAHPRPPYIIIHIYIYIIYI